MTRPLGFPISPMEAEAAEELPTGKAWLFEPKWDGFRCLLSKKGRKVILQSKAGKRIDRYFPEIVEAARQLPVETLVIDGELVIPEGLQLSFDKLLQRIHPAKTRIDRLSNETPAVYIVFDLLCEPNAGWVYTKPLVERRKLLERFAKKYFRRPIPFRLSPASADLTVAKKWLHRARGGLDGLMAKRRDEPYTPGERGHMQKVKFKRTADCVVGGFRYGTKGKLVGSLLLGLYDSAGHLNHVGFVSTAGDLKTAEFTRKLEKLIGAPGFTGKAPGGPSRWSTKRSAEWEPLRPKIVIEVEYDHLTGGRFRHGTRFIRFRPDKDPKQCKMKQVEQESGAPIGLL